MEIERKFLLQEKTIIYPSQFNLTELKNEILTSGKKITQSYLPKKLIPGILKILNKEINFKPSQLRIRKYGSKYFLTIKSSGGLSREEFEIKIKEEYYLELLQLKKKSLEKIRLVKKISNHNFEIDFYPLYNLMIAEIEFETVKLANNFETNMKEITTNKKYSNKNLAIRVKI